MDLLFGLHQSLLTHERLRRLGHLARLVKILRRNFRRTFWITESLRLLLCLNRMQKWDWLPIIWATGHILLNFVRCANCLHRLRLGKAVLNNLVRWFAIFAMIRCTRAIAGTTFKTVRVLGSLMMSLVAIGRIVANGWVGRLCIIRCGIVGMAVSIALGTIVHLQPLAVVGNVLRTRPSDDIACESMSPKAKCRCLWLHINVLRLIGYVHS